MDTFAQRQAQVVRYLQDPSLKANKLEKLIYLYKWFRYELSYLKAAKTQAKMSKRANAMEALESKFNARSNIV